MKKVNFLLIVALFTLTGCSLFRHSQTDKSLIKVDSVSSSNFKSITIDTGKTVTESHIDTIIRIPGVSIDKYFALKPGATFPGFSQAINNLDTAMVDLNMSYDSLHNAIRITGRQRPVTIPVKADTKTTITNGKSSITIADQNTAVKKKTEISHAETTPDYGWMWWVAGIIAAFFIVLYLDEHFKFFKR